MGNAYSSVSRRLGLEKEQQMRIIMNGLDGAGKTTILYKMKLGEVVTTIPSIGFNVETVEQANFTIATWDVQDQIRPLYRASYYHGCQGLIFVVDSCDDERIGQCSEELMKILADDETESAPLLVFANKQDLPDVMSVEEVSERLCLPGIRSRHWHIQESCALTGNGLWEGFDWLSLAMTQRVTEPQVACQPNHVLTQGRYRVIAKSLEVSHSPGVGEVTNQRIPRGTPVEVVEFSQPSDIYSGRIEEPVAGWIRFSPAFLQAPDLVLTLHVASPSSGRLSVSCYSMAGDVLTSVDALEQQTLTDLRMSIADRLKIDIRCLKLTLQDGRLLSNAGAEVSLGKMLEKDARSETVKGCVVG